MRVSGEKNLSPSQLHTHEVLSYTRLNHIFSLVYSCAILALIYQHILAILHTTSLISFLLHFPLLLSDLIFSFMWVTTQCSRLHPVKRKTHPENIPSVVQDKDYPALDVFICTADPYKEPPINVVNTALSVMAYDYPTDKLSVYVSDDGGSALTLFAFMEAAKFASHWLPFCREKNIMERCPEAYFGSDVHTWCSETKKIKIMYEGMKERVESVVERGCVGDEHITSEHDSQAFKKWTAGFTRQEHPTVIQVLLESEKDKDITGHGMPNLVYVSREKSRALPHHFKAGALNVLLRVSATMTNAPLVLTLDCDMYSNDPKTILNALCYILDPTEASSDLAFVQFPQRYYGINKNDIYGSEMKRVFIIDPTGMDGLSGPSYVGTGCFFQRRAFFGGPSSQLSAEIPELNPNNVIDKSIQSETVLNIAHSVASCNYENGTKWGSKIGFQYGSLVEDYNTGYRLQCEGWRSVLCDPDRAAFLGDVPINLNDVLSQVRRWMVGLLEVGFSKYSPITFGIKSMGLPMGFSYAHYAFLPIWSIPITIYAFLPSLALLNGVYIFPKVSSPWLYMFLFLGAYGQDLQDFILAGSTYKKWYNDQRMWMIKGVSSYLFGLIDFLLQSLGFSSAFGFNVTNKVVAAEQSKRYEQGLFEFGVVSPLFVPLATTAIINLIAFILGIAQTLKKGHFDEMFVQLCISGFVATNSWPIYEAMIFRVDKGRMPPKITLISICFAWVLYIVVCEGWRSVLCDPDRAAFLGDVPINLNDVLSQVRRWMVGLLEIGFSKYSPITFGIKSMGLPMGFSYAYYAFLPIWSIPITIYVFLPSLALLNGVYIFPKVSSPWLYMFLFLGAYGQDLQDFILAGSTYKKWYNDQRMWMVKGVSSYLFGLIDFLLQSLGFSSAFGFNVTNKVVAAEQSKRYEQGLFEFGVASPLFVPLATTAIINLIAFILGIAQTLKKGHFDEMFVQLCISGFVATNSWPIYEAMMFRVDKGRMPPKITLISICFAWVLYIISFLLLRN